MAATARDLKEVSYSDALLATFVGGVAILLVAVTLGVTGWLAENDSVTYWGIAAGLVGGIAIAYSTRKAKHLLGR